jgi:hypothetical protein
MLVDAQVSSMKTSDRGRDQADCRTTPNAVSERPGGPAPQRGRSFFARDPVPPEEPLQRAVAEPVAARSQGLTQFFHRRVRHLVKQLKDQSGLRLDSPGTAVATE